MTEYKNLDGIINVGSVLNSNKSDDSVNVQTNSNKFSSYSSLTESNFKYGTLTNKMDFAGNILIKFYSLNMTNYKIINMYYF